MFEKVLIPLEDVISDSFGKYSKYIIQDRAIPDARDGLKPGQRRIIYAMFKEGNTNLKPYRKSAKTVGNVIGNYHPHGDTSVYDAMVRMSQNWKLRYPLIDMHGNNGSIDDDPAAAMRYTESRMSKIASMLVENINDETVPWSYNFDDTELEPVVLTSKIPNLLINGASGIASGYATEIPPHNLQEVIDGAIYIIQNPKWELNDLMKIIKGPDFPTGGIISSVSGIKDAFETGRGRIMLRAKTSQSDKEISITEIPFGVHKSALVREIETAIVNSSIIGVSHVRDESDRTGLKISIGLDGKVAAETILNFLFQKTKLQTWYNYNMVSIVDKKPMLAGVGKLIEKFVKHQLEVFVNKMKFKKSKLEVKIHILEGLVKAAENIDKIIMLIRSSKSKSESKQAIIKEFNFTEQQAEAIVNLRLYRLSATNVDEFKKELTCNKKDLANIIEIINSDAKINQELIKELEVIKEEFGDKRRTKIKKSVEISKIETKDLIQAEDVWVSVSKNGYIKQSTPKSYKSSKGVSLNKQDALIGEFQASTFSHLITFFDDGTFTSIPIHEIKSTKWKDKGQHISSLITLPAEASIIKTFIYSEGDDFLLALGTSSGMAKRTAINDFILSRWKKPSVGIKLKPSETLIGVHKEVKSGFAGFISESGFMNKYPITELSISGPKASGVKGIKLANEEAIGFIVCSGDKQIMFVTDKNQAKRIAFEKIPESSRTAKGTRINKLIKTSPQYIIWMSYVTASQKIQITTEEATFDFNVSEVPLLDINSGNNKFINKKDIIYSINKKSVNEKSITKKSPAAKSPAKINLKETKTKEVSNQMDLFDILDEI